MNNWVYKLNSRKAGKIILSYTKTLDSCQEKNYGFWQEYSGGQNFRFSSHSKMGFSCGL